MNHATGHARRHGEGPKVPAVGANAEFASAESVMGASSPQARRSSQSSESPDRPESRDSIKWDRLSPGELDKHIAAEVESLLDLPMPFESVDEALATPLRESALPKEPATDAPARDREPAQAAGRPCPPESNSAKPGGDTATVDAEAPASGGSMPVEQGSKAQPHSRGSVGATTAPATVGSCVRLLMAINAPMRLVPRSMQSIVSIAALSLVFWAPVVWLLAWYVFRN